MKYTVYGIVFESNYYFDYFNLCSDPTTVDMQVDVIVNPDADIPSVNYSGEDWFEISQPGVVMYRYANHKLDILAKDDACIKSTISTVPFVLAVSQKGGVLFHAACVMSKASRKAGIFLAPSGVGKSTIINYLVTCQSDDFQFVSDDAIAVYVLNEIPYVYNGPTFSKLDPSIATLIGVTGREKTVDNSKILINRNSETQKNYSNIEEQKIELGALFFIAALPKTESSQIKLMDQRSVSTFIKTSTVAHKFDSMAINNIVLEQEKLICDKVKSYILCYSQKAASLNLQLCGEIHERIS